MRSVLTALGLIIGVAAVITVVSVMDAFSNRITAKFESLGNNGLTLSAYTPLKHQIQGRLTALKASDLDIIKRVSGVRHITPVFFPTNGAIKSNGYESFSQVYATTEYYQDVNQNYPTQGRFINRTDNLKRRKVVVLGVDTVDELKFHDDPIGRYVQIEDEWFKVIGVQQRKGKLFGLSQDSFAIIPYETGRSIAGYHKEPQFFVQFSVADLNQLEPIKRHLTREIRKNHQLSKGQQNDFKLETAEQMMETFNSISEGVTFVLIGMVGISLVVGGVGIMNIMLVSVTERTREIGIQKALGAQPTNILLQFLVEAVLLSVTGGALGVILGLGLGQLVELFSGIENIEAPTWAVLLSFVFSATVGVVFGLIPAAKASSLHPIEALRFE